MSDLPAFLRDAPPRRSRTSPPLAIARPGHIPGEAGLWVLLVGDMTVFALLFGAFLVSRGSQGVAFAAGRRQLSVQVGAAETIALLTSSLLIAVAVRAHRQCRMVLARRLILGAGACAVVFAALKASEWGVRIHAGDTPTSGTFFMYYFAITGVHFAHLLVGGVALTLMHRTIGRGQPGPTRRRKVESCASYWHMVDLLWVVIYPVLYLAAT